MVDYLNKLFNQVFDSKHWYLYGLFFAIYIFMLYDLLIALLWRILPADGLPIYYALPMAVLSLAAIFIVGLLLVTLPVRLFSQRDIGN